MTKRFEPHRRNVHMTEKDYATLRALFDARYLTNQMVGDLFYTPTTMSWCRQRLRYLYDGGYIGKRKASPNEPDVYFLGKRGRTYIREVTGLDTETIKKMCGVEGEGAPFLMMRHDLTLSGLYVKAVLECRRYSWTVRWQNARALELKNLGVQPDAHLKVQGPVGSKEAFVEFTAVLPTATELNRKLEGYRRLYERIQRGMPILWLTDERRKLEQLKRGSAGWDYEDFVLLGLIDETSEFLTGNIWQQRGERVSLIAAPK